MSKDYIRPMPRHWWTTRPGWRTFMWREWTALPIAIYCGILIVMAAKSGSAESFHGFYEWLKSPLSIIIHVIALVFSIVHTFTWFEAAPKALRVFRGAEQVPGELIAAGHFAAWVAVSAVFTFIVVWW
jgi:fumarate reductase subunit C